MLFKWWVITPYPDVHLPGEESLRDPECVEERPRDVEEAHEAEPAETGLRDGPLPPILDSIVSGRGYPGESEDYEDQSSVRPVSRCAELVPETDHHGQDAQHDDDWHVQYLGE